MRRTLKICLFYLTAAAGAWDASGSAWSGAGVTALGQSGRPSVGNFHQIAYSFKGKRGPGLAIAMHPRPGVHRYGRSPCAPPTRPPAASAACARRCRPRVRSHRRFTFRNRSTEYVRKSGMKRMGGSTKRRCGRARCRPFAAASCARYRRRTPRAAAAAVRHPILHYH
jgi:hypothetical protein